MNTNTRQNVIIERAFIWLEHGISVIPALPRSKEVRTTWGIYQDKQPDKEQVIQWFKIPGANLAVVCGTGGLVVLDFDDRSNFETWFSAAGDLAMTYTEFTSRGAHVFYLVQDQPVRTCALDEVEILGKGHLCLVYPSVHPSGFTYIPAHKESGWKVKSVRAHEFEQSLDLFSRREVGEVFYPSKESKHYPPAQDDLISKIKESFPILDFARSWSDPKPSGGNRYYLCHCLWHDDENPSLWIDTVLGLWGCFSPSCPVRKGGDVINLYALYHGLSNQEAIKRLAGGLR